MSANPYSDLRGKALNAFEMDLTHRSSAHPGVDGLVTDIPSDGGTATIVALADGATSLYTSTGGGTIGAGEHESVAEATSDLLEQVQGHLELFPADEDTSHPGSDYARLFVLTPNGRRKTDVPLELFWAPDQSSIPALLGAIQDVMTAINRIEPRR